MTNGEGFSRGKSQRGAGLGQIGRPQPGCIAGSHAFDVGLARANPNTRCEVVGFDFNQRWYYLLAGVDHIWTTRMKAAARGWIDRRGHVPLKHDALTRGLYFRIRNRKDRKSTRLN